MAKARTELIHCDNCGEDYAATYRRCPFCNAKRSKGGDPSDDYEQPDYGEGDYDYEAPRRGGKRLAEGKSSGGNRRTVKTVLYLLSSLVILAAIWIMCSMLIPKLLDRAPAPSPDAAEPSAVTAAPTQDADAVQTAAPTPDAAESWEPLPGVVDDPLDLDSPDLPTVEPDPYASAAPTATPRPTSTPAPTAQTSAAPGSALKLSSADFTLNSKDRTYRIRATGAEGGVSFSIKNQAVATVSENGTVTAVGNGSTTLTATDAAGKTATCIVRVAGMDAAQTAAPTQAPGEGNASSGSARLSTTDFSISADYPDPVRIRVLDGQAASWSSKNESVATVSDNGTVTAVGNGSTQILCTLSDGSTLSCSVYVSGK